MICVRLGSADVAEATLARLIHKKEVKKKKSGGLASRCVYETVRFLS